MSVDENSAVVTEMDEDEDSFVVIDEVTDNQTENDKGQGTELGSELLLDSVETEKEIDSFLKNESKPQVEASNEEKPTNSGGETAPKLEGKVVKNESKYDTRISSDYVLAVGSLRSGDKRALTQMLLKKFGKNKYIMKPTRLGDKYTYLHFRSRECMKTAEKMLNNKVISNHRITAKVVEKKRTEKKVEIKIKDVPSIKKPPEKHDVKLEKYGDEVKYKEKDARLKVLTLGDRLNSYLSPLKSLISERIKRYNGIICKLDKLKQCVPREGSYCKCNFLIDIDEDTGKPILGRFAEDGKVQKNWLGKEFYHPSILEAADVFEKLVTSSTWEVGRRNKGFWRKIHIFCNNSGELFLWVLVQSPEGKALDEIRKMKVLFREFFEKGEGKKCKISSIYTRVTFTSTSTSSEIRSDPLIKLIMGSEQFEQSILGFKIKTNPTISTLWDMEKSSMMCKVVKDLLALDNHTSVIIIGLNDSGLLALTLAKVAGEIICVDKRPAVEEAKLNVIANQLESKCKFCAGFAAEELPKLSPKYKKVYAVILVPNVTKIMAFKERANLSTVKTVVTFIDSSILTSRPLKVLADPEQGTPFFPSRIIPFDTVPNEKTYMMAIRLDRVNVPEAEATIVRNLSTSSARRHSNISSLTKSYRDRKTRTQGRPDVSVGDKRERNRMLPDAREVILARRYRKEKEQLRSASRFNSYEQPNLVIEVKKPNFGSTRHGEAFAQRCVKERKIEGEEYRQRSMEGKNMRSRTKQTVQDVLAESLKQSFSSLNEDTAEKLKQVITEAITGAGLLGSSNLHERKRRSNTPPRVSDRRSERYVKYNQHDSTEQRYGKYISRGEEKQNEISRNSYSDRALSRSDKRPTRDEKYERMPSPRRVSPNYINIRDSLERNKGYGGSKYEIDRIHEEDRSYGSRRETHRNDYNKEVLPSGRSLDSEARIHRRTVEHEREILSSGRRVEADTYDRGMRSSFGRISPHNQRNIDKRVPSLSRRELDLTVFEKQSSSLVRRSLEDTRFSKRGPPERNIYDEREPPLVRKRNLEIESLVAPHAEKRRRSQDRDRYDDRGAPPIKRSSLGDIAYCNPEQRTEVPRYIVREDHSQIRKIPDVDRYERNLITERINERDRQLLIRRENANAMPQIPFSVRDFRPPATTMEKQNMLPQIGFTSVPPGGTSCTDRRPVYQSLDRHMGSEGLLPSASFSEISLQRNSNMPQPPGIEFNRRPSYPVYAPPR